MLPRSRKSEARKVTGLAMHNHKPVLYNLPKYYDLAFDRDMTHEIEFYQNCFKKYAPEIKVRRILEPACGTGILLEYLARAGYQCVGYDLSESMVSYSNHRLMQKKLHERAQAVLGDMRTKYFTKLFDAAIICINSLGYLTNDTDIINHFKAISRSLVPGGLYITEISCACDNILNEKKPDETWTVEQGAIKLTLTWAPTWYDYQKKIRHVDFFMKGKEYDQEFELEEGHDLRLWLFDDLVQFAKAGEFQLVGIYTQEFKEIPLGRKITGEDGVLYFIMKNLTAKD